MTAEEREAQKCIDLDAENAKLVKQNDLLRQGIKAVAYLIANSSGVYGLHLNGENAPWGDLCEGGCLEEWLIDFDTALDEAANE